MKKILLNLFVILIVGCGYRPTIDFAKDKYSNKKGFIEVNIDYDNANNSVYLKDALIEFAVNKLNLILVEDKNKAQIKIFGKINSISQTQLQSDTSGFGKIYRENVSLFIKINDKSYTLSSYFDFSIDPNSGVTESKKEEAIKNAIEKALNSLFSKVAIEELKSKKR